MRKLCTILALFFVAIATLFFSACLKTYKLIPSESNQGEMHKDGREIVKNNLRSVRVYDEWQTDAMFDVIWLSDQTRTSYADAYCTRRGKSDAAHAKKLASELEKNNDTIEFYVLADVRDKFHPSLSDVDAAWTMYLEIDGKKVVPKNIIQTDLESEIVALFGHRFPRKKFKLPYIVTFPGSIRSRTEPFKMVISSVTRQCELGWLGGHPVLMKKVACNDKRKTVKDEDYYWL